MRCRTGRSGDRAPRAPRRKLALGAVSASAWTSVRGPADLFVETATAVLTAARRSTDEEVVTTQGRHLTAAPAAHAVPVEAAVHQLDLDREPALPDPPEDGVLAEVRHVL